MEYYRNDVSKDCDEMDLEVSEASVLDNLGCFDYALPTPYYISLLPRLF